MTKSYGKISLDLDDLVDLDVLQHRHLMEDARHLMSLRLDPLLWILDLHLDLFWSLAEA